MLRKFEPYYFLIDRKTNASNHIPALYVTRFAKTDHVRTKIEIRFFGPANSCTQ